MAPNRSTSPMDTTQAHTGSPPPLSKRDKKRTMLTDKLNAMIRDFNQNLRPHYEAQVQAIQVDINLIMKANPYQNVPLPDSVEEVDQIVQDLFGGPLQLDPVMEQDFNAEAGKHYSQFAKEVNDLIEERDVALTVLANKHERTLDEIDRKHQFNVQIAHEEHQILSHTVRSRLHSRLRKQRELLLGEKEQLDIGDSNSALLHPDKFSTYNPGSPGGAGLNSRKTRNARHRAGDPDDLPSAANALENRRKRKAAFDDTDGSPGPMTKQLDLGTGSPFKDAKAKVLYSQYDSPSYSVDRLFTEKELAMNINIAANAAKNFLTKLKDRPVHEEATNGINGHQADSDDATLPVAVETLPNETTDESAELGDATPAAAEMDRSASVQPHQTRNTTRSALNDLAAAAETQMPYQSHAIPTYFPAVIGSKANGAAPGPLAAGMVDVEQDFRYMSRTDIAGDDPTSNKLLEHAVGKVDESAPGGPKNWVEFQYQAPVTANASDREDLLGHRELLAGIGGVNMSRQTSMGGMSDAGAQPMSRTGSALGGRTMQRTTSGIGRRGRA